LAGGGLSRAFRGENWGTSLSASSPMTIALLVALAGSLGLMAFIVKRLENS
jgi:hypothetical protein